MMPLQSGDTLKEIGRNIALGNPRNRAIAAALSLVRRGRAEGGQVTATKYHVGPIHSPVAGRTDHLPIHVLSGSYVLPADIISAMGQGNTMAGFRVAKDMFGQSFYGNAGAGKGTPYGSGDSLPYGVSSPHRTGGGTGHNGGPPLVPIIAAGGEFVIHPSDVARVGHGDVDDGHQILDHFVKGYRAKTIKTLSKLPGPRKD